MPIISPVLPTDGDDITQDSNNIPLLAILSLINGNLDADNLVNGGVTTIKIQDASVTLAKLAPFDKILLYQKVDVSLPNNTSTAITYGATSESYKIGSIAHSTTVNTSRVTVGTTGYYRLSGCVRYAGGNTTNRYETAFLVNGTGTARGGMSVPATATSVLVTAYTEVYLVAGDYVELLGFQQTGGTITAQALNTGTFFSVSLMP